MHPFIAKHAADPNWSMSNLEKVPVDMRPNYHYRGANPYIDGTTCSLRDVISRVDEKWRPRIWNFAYHIRAMRDEFCVIDIEKSCDEAIRERLLNLPWLYGEVSMSNLGYHLVMPLPDNFYRFEAAATRSAVKHASGGFEILVNHWVTFTGNLILPRDNDTDWNALWANMARNVKAVSRRDIQIDENDLALANEACADYAKMDIDSRRFSERKSLHAMDDFLKDPNARGLDRYDMSRYEYYLMTQLKTAALEYYNVMGEESPDDETLVMTLYVAYLKLKEEFPFIAPDRPKHEQTRQGLPWLLYTAQECVAKTRD